MKKQIKKALDALVGVNREYLMIAMQTGDQEYITSFNAMMATLRRLEDES